MVSRRVAIRDILRTSLCLGLAAGASGLAGCGGEQELPVVASGKNKDDLQKDIENPLGVPVKKGRRSGGAK